MFRSAIARQARLFSTSPIVRKSPVETVKDAAKAVDRTISDAAVKGIEKGEQATQTIKEVLPNSTGEAKGKASELAGEAKGKAAELSGSVKGKANEVTPDSSSQAKGQAQEMMGQAKGKASELAGEAKGKAQEVKGEVKGKM